MEIYMVAVTSGKYMFPIDNKIYKRLSAAQKSLDKYKKEKPGTDNLKILKADNWHEV